MGVAAGFLEYVEKYVKKQIQQKYEKYDETVP